MCTLCSINPVAEFDGGHDTVVQSQDSSNSLAALGSSSVSFNGSTGDANIDGLMWDAKWSSLNITYSFPDEVTDYGTSDQNYHGQDFLQMTNTQQDATEEWLAMVESVTNLSFTELSNENDADADATLKFSNGALYDPASGGSITAFAYLPSSNSRGGDSWFGFAGWLPDQETEYQYIGSYDYLTIGHELGHALGLVHGHDTTNPYGAMEYEYDAMEYSIMTYRSYQGADTANGYTNAHGGYAQSLMMYDIAALQEMYGADYTTNSSSTTYTWDAVTGAFYINGVEEFDGIGSTVFHTIWDGGGNDDHYDLSNFSTDLYINLAPGAAIDLDTQGNQYAANLGNGNYASGSIYNALMYNGSGASLIENATGGSGNDEIWGNRKANELNGGEGEDVIYGLGGNDLILGEGGKDILFGGNGLDYMYGGDENDILYGRVGRDFIFGGYGKDTLVGGSNNDRLSGEVGRDKLYGEFGEDVLNGGTGNDLLVGGRDNDTLIGGNGADTFVFRNSNDVQTDTITDFSTDDDVIQLAKRHNFETLVITEYGENGSQIAVDNTVILVEGVGVNEWLEDHFEFV